MYSYSLGTMQLPSSSPADFSIIRTSLITDVDLHHVQYFYNFQLQLNFLSYGHIRHCGYLYSAVHKALTQEAKKDKSNNFLCVLDAKKVFFSENDYFYLFLFFRKYSL